MSSCQKSIGRTGQSNGSPLGGALTAAAANLGGSTSRLHSSALRNEAQKRRYS